MKIKRNNQPEDILNFMDSERDSVMSYFEMNSTNFIIDTPTKLINESNDFIPQSKLFIKKKEEHY